jgi:hypothetical protein
MESEERPLISLGAQGYGFFYATILILYNSKVGDGVRLGPLTLVAKGEQLPAETRWEGSPAGRR